MRALRFHGMGDLRVEDIEEPNVRPGAVKIDVHWCGICGTDLHEYTAGPIAVPSGEPHPITGEQAPVVMGHEFAGEVLEVGDGVEGVEVGDQVAIEPLIRDNECEQCRRGSYNLCPQVGFHGISGGGGGLAERTVVPEYMVHRLPEGMSTYQGALVEPVAVGLHAVRKSGLELGETALLMGAGPVGLVTLLCLRAAGARLVAVGEPAEVRYQLAADLGADVVFDPTERDVTEVMAELDLDGFDKAFETSGVPAALQTTLDAVRPEGRVCEVALWEEAVQLDMNQLVFAEIDLTASLAYAGDYPATMAMMSDGRIDAERLVTATVDLDDAVEGAFDELVERKDEHVKILIRP